MDRGSSLLASMLTDRFISKNIPTELVSLGKAFTARFSRVVSLVEIPTPIFLDIQSAEWTSLQQILAHTTSLLWITNGGLLRGRQPLFSMFGGIARGLRTERGDMKISVLDLDRAEDQMLDRLCELIPKLLEPSPRGSNDTYETEYREKDGIIFCGRLQPDVSLNEDWSSRARNQTSADMVPIKQLEDTRIRLDIDKPHVLSTMHFRADPDFDTSLPDDWVEIKAAAFGINNRVGMIGCALTRG